MAQWKCNTQGAVAQIFQTTGDLLRRKLTCNVQHHEMTVLHNMHFDTDNCANVWNDFVCGRSEISHAFLPQLKIFRAP